MELQHITLSLTGLTAGILLLLSIHAWRRKAAAPVIATFLVFLVHYLSLLIRAAYPESLALVTVNWVSSLLEGPALWWLAISLTTGEQGRPHWAHLVLPLALPALNLIDSLPLSHFVYLSGTALRATYVGCTAFVIIGFYKRRGMANWIPWASVFLGLVAVMTLVTLANFVLWITQENWRMPKQIALAYSLFTSLTMMGVMWWALVKPDVYLNRNTQRSSREPGDFDREVFDRFIELVENEKLYLKDDLSLADAADAIAVLPRELSEAINRTSGKNFKSVIRQYRVAKACALMTARDHQESGILEIAHLAGFATKSAFNSAFKSETGLTPSDYRAQAERPN